MERAPDFETFIAVYPVQDLAATRDFYARDLGLRLERERRGQLLFRVGSALVGFRQGDLPAAAHPELALTLTCRDVDAAYRRLRRLGVETEAPPRRPGPGRVASFVAHDPDGYRVLVRRALEPGVSRSS